MLVATRDGEAQSSEVVAEAPYSTLSTRSHQMFPTLTPAEIERVRRFGDLNHWHAGEYLFRTGHMGPGMIVMLSGTVRITQRDGLGRENLVVEHKGAGQFLAEVGQLSGKLALVDGIATMPVSAVLIPPERLRALIIAEAELGEYLSRLAEKSVTVKLNRLLADGDTVVALTEVTVGYERGRDADVFTLRDGKTVRVQVHTDTAIMERVYGRKQVAAG